MNPSQVVEGVFQLRFGRIKAWLVHWGAGAALIDTGLPAHGLRILACEAPVHIHGADAACYCFGHGPPLERGAALRRLAG